MQQGFGLLGLALAFAAGLSFMFQQAVNANLRLEIQSVWWAGLASYVGGTIAMLAAAVLLRAPFPSTAAIARTHVLSWTGGLFGAAYIAVSIFLLPQLGAATLIGFVVAGQLIGSILFDHFGLLGVPVHSLTAPRAIGAGMLVFGAILVRH